MKLSDYFISVQGSGILATADKHGVVDAAVYARPHFLDEQTVAFIMADKLSHKNVRENPNAVYLFKENGDGYQGKRLSLSKIEESTDKALIDIMRRSEHCWPETTACDTEQRFLVVFRICAVRPLVGSGGE